MLQPAVELAEVAVVAHNKGGSGSNGAIDKLVIVWIGGNEVKTVGGTDTLDVRGLNQFFHHGIGDEGVVSFGEYLMIFK